MAYYSIFCCKPSNGTSPIIDTLSIRLYGNGLSRTITGTTNYGIYQIECYSSDPSTVYLDITDSSGKYVNRTGLTANKYANNSQFDIYPITMKGYVNVNLASSITYNGSTHCVASISSSSGTAYLGFGRDMATFPTSWGSANASLYETSAAAPGTTYYVYAKCDATTDAAAVYNKYVGSVTVQKGNGSIGTAITPSAQTYSGGRYTFSVESSGATNTVNIGTITSIIKNGSSVSSSGWSYNSTAHTVTTASGIDTGTYLVTLAVSVAATTYYNAASGTCTWSLTVNKADQAAPTVTSSSSTYGNSVTGGYSGGSGQGTLYYRVDTNGGTSYGSATTSAPTRSALGTTTYIAYWGGNSNYNASPNSSQGVLTISKSAGYVNTAPTNNGVTYDSGSYLCSAGSNASGTIYYSLSYSTGYSQTRPTATSDLNAGSYIVYYYAAATTYYEQSQIYSVSVTIVKAPYPYTFSISPTSATIYNTSGYNTVRITPFNDYSSVSYSSSNSSVATVTTTGSKYGDVTYKAAGTAYIYATASGGTNYEDAYATCTITCTEDYIVNYDYAPSGYWARLTIGSGLSASGGSAGVTATGGHNFYYLYASGYYTGPYSTSSDGASWSITYDNNSRFYKSGNYLYHRSMGTTATTDYVTITATNGSGSTDANRSITNSLESISLSVSKNPISYDESTTCSVSATYTSGASADVTSSAEISVGTSGIVTIS